MHSYAPSTVRGVAAYEDVDDAAVRAGRSQAPEDRGALMAQNRALPAQQCGRLTTERDRGEMSDGVYAGVHREKQSAAQEAIDGG
jgi:hypothetical protein